ncbi:hypothetical protein PAXRUDRAFT_20992 [Paxillus rubicundulus Ve08.2h10]|uniref:Uncharacterized protein n=1 Tax=Paxillus rubicundulus Ve08.2h10 TaxID=930991 RepID=A0A0D0D0F1_9AGAM|nr:hypothetical protein PAXRUDRAFT_20992 [Paxillus rubicundulus Ve08.2h10]
MSMEQATSMPCQHDSPWALTDLIMEYMHHRFHAELFPMTDPTGILLDVNIPAEIGNPDFDLGTEAHHASAFLCNVASDGENFCDPTLAGYIPLSEPAILIVESGEVITLYLPAAVSQYSQVGFILEDIAE